MLAHRKVGRRIGRNLTLAANYSVDSLERRILLSGVVLDGSFGPNHDGLGVIPVYQNENDRALGVTVDSSGTAATNLNYGKILVVGSLTADGQTLGHDPFGGVARFNVDGTLDTS